MAWINFDFGILQYNCIGWNQLINQCLSSTDIINTTSHLEQFVRHYFAATRWETVITAGHLIIRCLFTTYGLKYNGTFRTALRLSHNRRISTLITAGTAPASAVDTFYHLFLPEVLGHSADASGCKVVVSCLDAAKAAEALITWLQKDSREKSLVAIRRIE